MSDAPRNPPPSRLQGASHACPLCGREMVTGPSVQSHHVTPKSKGGDGGSRVDMHAVCHRMLHKVFDEAALARLARQADGGWEEIRANGEMARFINWVRKKPADFIDLPRTKGRRPYHRAH